MGEGWADVPADVKLLIVKNPAWPEPLSTGPKIHFKVFLLEMIAD